MSYRADMYPARNMTAVAKANDENIGYIKIPLRLKVNQTRMRLWVVTLAA